MQIFSILIYVITIFGLIGMKEANKNKSSGSKYDRAYSKCKSSECSTRSNDEACIFKCVSAPCYEQIYGDYTLEYGEVNYDLKNRFESCFNTQKQ
jgi:hypothetical protein